MIQVGKIKKYNEERGFGFIEVDETKNEIFFHIKDFPKGKAPQLGEKLTFSIQQYENKLKAVNIIRLDFPAKTKTLNQHRKNKDAKSESSNFLAMFLGLLFTVGVIYFVYGYVKDALHRQELASKPVTSETIHISNQQAVQSSTNFRCDGRIHCSQMTSKAEADWFVANCPGTQMDGDGDGEACERQFGNSW